MRVFHTFQKEIQPGLPISFGPDQIEQAIVLWPVLFEIEAQVEQRFRQHAAVMQHEGNQQAADAAVAVKKRVKRLELHVRERRFDQSWIRGMLVMNESLK